MAPTCRCCPDPFRRHRGQWLVLRSRCREGDASSTDPIIPLPLARAALGLVGTDSDAEAAWMDAINDPNLPANARKDLIEDLNEEGLPDAAHLTPGRFTGDLESNGID